MDNDILLQKQSSVCIHTIMIVVLLEWADSAELQWNILVKFRCRNSQDFSGIFNFVDFSVKRAITYDFFFLICIAS